jgi:hypothetical protein
MHDMSRCVFGGLPQAFLEESQVVVHHQIQSKLLLTSPSTWPHDILLWDVGQRALLHASTEGLEATQPHYQSNVRGDELSVESSIIADKLGNC